MNSGIYCITNQSNGKMYIGQTVHLQKRKKQHFWRLNEGVHKNKHLQRAYNKYGKSAFVFRVILLCDIENLTFFEQLVVDLYKPGQLYNIALECVTGTLGVIPSEETRIKMGNAHRGAKHSEETKRKMSKAARGEKNPNYGKSPSEETRRKLSETHKGKNCYWYGKHHSKETREKISRAKFGSKHSEESKEKMSLARRGENNPNYGKKLSVETKRKLSKAASGKRHSENAKKKISLASRGENNRNSKLTKKQVTEILNLHYNHDISRKDLLERFDVSKATINGIIAGRGWKYVYKEFFNQPLSRGYLTPPSGA